MDLDSGEKTYVVSVRRSYSLDVTIRAISLKQALELYEEGEGEEEVTDAATDRIQKISCLEEEVQNV